MFTALVIISALFCVAMIALQHYSAQEPRRNKTKLDSAKNTGFWSQVLHYGTDEERSRVVKETMESLENKRAKHFTPRREDIAENTTMIEAENRHFPKMENMIAENTQNSFSPISYARKTESMVNHSKSTERPIKALAQRIEYATHRTIVNVENVGKQVIVEKLTKDERLEVVKRIKRGESNRTILNAVFSISSGRKYQEYSAYIDAIRKAVMK